MSWNAGYVTDVNYTFGYYPELSADRAVYALTSAGFRAPIVQNACELGFGQGMSVAIHAATQPNVQWWGTDFNPTQAAFAQELVSKSGASAKLFDEAFAEFCARDDLPEFEFIALHGIWTWISDENRAVIVDFLRRKLAVGGILYISYNTLPGWSAAAPLRHLMKQHAEVMGAPAAGVTQRIDDSLAFMDRLFAVDPAYARNNALAVERFNGLKTQNRNYMAHEYMNRDWRPMYFSDMAEWLEPTKLTYTAAAPLLDQQESVNILPAQSAVLASVTDPGFKETVRDYITGQQFRRDLWMRGPRRMTAIEHADTLRALRFILTIPRKDVALKLKAAQGEVTLQEGVYKPILDFMADHQIKTFNQIEAAGQSAGLTLAQVVAATSVLVGMGTLAPVQDDKTIAKAKPAVDKLNKVLISMSRSRSDIPYLASAVTGCGYAVNRLEQLFLFARGQGAKTAQDWAATAWQLLSMQGQRLMREGTELVTNEDNLAELLERAKEFEQRLPLLRQLAIA
jgi:hypothetical protein